jgi:hypothetical protein
MAATQVRVNDKSHSWNLRFDQRGFGGDFSCIHGVGGIPGRVGDQKAFQQAKGSKAPEILFADKSNGQFIISRLIDKSGALTFGSK